MTVTRIVTLGGAVHVIVRTSETRRKHEGPKSDSYMDGSFEASKTTTVTRMATSSCPTPVSVVIEYRKINK